MIQVLEARLLLLSKLIKKWYSILADTGKQADYDKYVKAVELHGKSCQKLFEAKRTK